MESICRIFFFWSLWKNGDWTQCFSTLLFTLFDDSMIFFYVSIECSSFLIERFSMETDWKFLNFNLGFLWWKILVFCGTPYSLRVFRLKNTPFISQQIFELWCMYDTLRILITVNIYAWTLLVSRDVLRICMNWKFMLEMMLKEV